MKALPFYPKFVSIDDVDPRELGKILDSFEPYSDFNFISLYSWNTDGSAQLSNLYGNVVLSLPDYMGGDNIISILGSNKVKLACKILLENHKILNLVPEVVEKEISDSLELKITPDEDNFDYLYSLESLSTLAGPSFRSKRKRLKKLASEHSSVVFTNHSFPFSDNKGSVLDLFDQWSIHITENREAKNESHLERAAISRLVEASSLGQYSQNLLLTVMRVGDKNIGFSINEFGKDCSTCHFQKTLLDYKNMDIYLTNYVSKHLFAKGSKLINWEQDLGIVGLRSFKQSYNPVRLLKKYNIELAR